MSDNTSPGDRHPALIAAVTGSFALAVALVVQASGVMRGANLALLERYLAAGFAVEGDGSRSWGAVLVLVLLVFGIALLLLDVPGTARRAMVAASLLVLVAAASPVIALWGTFWSPFLAVVGGAWSAFCVILWARQNPMPCERVEIPRDGKVISLVEEQEKRRQG